MDDAKQDYRKYLEPSVLAQISDLELRARLIVEGFFSGMHHSPHHGVSVEFADHRAYTQGDDVRHIDWKVFGKTDKYYIKEYEQETNLNMMLVVDASASMDYVSVTGEQRSSLLYPGGLSKYAYATTAAAATAYLALRQQDAVGVALFDEKLTEFVNASNSAHHWKIIVRALAGKTGRAKTSLGQVLHELAERLTNRTLIILISDLFDDVEVTLRGCRNLRYRGHELIVWNIWDHAELTLPLSGPTMFDGLESEGKLLADPRSLQAHYLEEVDSFLDQLRRGCGRLEADFMLFDTASPLDAALRGYLGGRSARLRQRSSRVMGGA